jgi:copper(I)-binding protein
MTRDDIIRMAREAGIPETATEGVFIANSDDLGRLMAAEREACASVEVHLTTPDRDYTNMSPLDAYEAALMDAAIAFREAIRARGQHGD